MVEEASPMSFKVMYRCTESIVIVDLTIHSEYRSRLMKLYIKVYILMCQYIFFFIRPMASFDNLIKYLPLPKAGR